MSNAHNQPKKPVSISSVNITEQELKFETHVSMNNLGPNDRDTTNLSDNYQTQQDEAESPDETVGEKQSGFTKQVPTENTNAKTVTLKILEEPEKKEELSSNDTECGNSISNSKVSKHEPLPPTADEANLSSLQKQDSADTANFANHSPDFNSDFSKTPVIPEDVYSALPILLQEGSDVFKLKRERDVFLTGALCILSGCFKRVQGLYDGKVVYPSLFGFIIAPAASGKSALVHARELGIPLHKSFRSTASMASAALGTNSHLQGLYIPGNTSSAAIMGHLHANKGEGIICETEADTLNIALKQDWGNFSDILRKAFHHETLTSSRISQNSIEIDTPKLSIALSGTPNQIQSLIRSTDDGLYSRFIYYCYKAEQEWKDVSNENKVNFTTFFATQGNKVLALAKSLNAHSTFFDLTKSQFQILNKEFDSHLNILTSFVSEDASSIVKRLGLVCYRIAMLLSILRIEKAISDPKLAPKDMYISCTDQDFTTALTLSNIYLQHSITLYLSLPRKEQLQARKKAFYDALPQKFSRKNAIQIGSSKGLAERTCDEYIKHLKSKGFLKETSTYGEYEKVDWQRLQNEQSK